MPTSRPPPVPQSRRLGRQRAAYEAVGLAGAAGPVGLGQRQPGDPARSPYAWNACTSVMPTRPTSGSVNTTHGTAAASERRGQAAGTAAEHDHVVAVGVDPPSPPVLRCATSRCRGSSRPAGPAAPHCQPHDTAASCRRAHAASSRRRDPGGAITRVAVASVHGKNAAGSSEGKDGQRPSGESGLRERAAPMTPDVASGPLVVAAGISLAAGAVSFASPYVLPLVPGYPSFVSGLSGADMAEGGARARGAVVAGAGLFLLGVWRPRRLERERRAVGLVRRGGCWQRSPSGWSSVPAGRRASARPWPRS